MNYGMPLCSTITDTWRFARGVRRLVRNPSHLDQRAVLAAVRERHAHRSASFVKVLDELVWPYATNPTRRLLEHAGFRADDVAESVRSNGLETALGELRDAGVYVRYDEWLGRSPIRRGSLTIDAGPSAFWNPTGAQDYLTRTGGSRTNGTPVARSFDDFGPSVARSLLRRAVWEVERAPTAVWLPGFPSAGGLNTVLRHQIMGQPAERWFTPAPRSAPGFEWEKRLANLAIPAISLTAGVRLPLPRYASPSDPRRVLAWCQDALARHGRAVLASYTTSAVQLARLATERGVRLDGLVVFMAGEPVTTDRARAVRASGAQPANVYSFTQHGTGAQACPQCPDEELHVSEHAVAVVSREVLRPDGIMVDALCWTTLDTASRAVFVNVENDDYGTLTRDEEPCTCLLGRIGFRWRLSHVRGVSKVVSGGVTVKGDLLERLVERVLPEWFGGEPGRWQFVEATDDGMALMLRADPSLGPLDDEAVLRVVREELRSTEPGALADAVWERGGVGLVRASPKATRSGKVLAYELFDRRPTAE